MPERTIAPIQIQDLPDISSLSPEGWGDIRKSVLSYCLHPFCHPIKVVDNNRIIGIGTIVLHAHSAWLAHVIVDSSYRGQGIGQQIVQYLLNIAQEENIPSVNLIATDLGAPVYDRAGFRAVGNYIFLKKVKDWTPQPVSTQLMVGTPLQHQQIRQLDRQITGEDRSKLIDEHLHSSIIFQHNGTVLGYYLPNLGQGPIYALTEQAGLALMELKYTYEDTAVLPQANTVSIDFLLQRGFAIEQTTAIRMVYGADTPWLPQHIYSRIGGNHG